jgi:hypothetical protein
MNHQKTVICKKKHLSVMFDPLKNKFFLKEKSPKYYPNYLKYDNSNINIQDMPESLKNKYFVKSTNLQNLPII